jgi:hypothetical protein
VECVKRAGKLLIIHFFIARQLVPYGTLFSVSWFVGEGKIQ